MLKIIIKCLGRQIFKDFEWIIVMPQKIVPDLSSCYQNGLFFESADKPGNMKLLLEPEKREGDFYNLNKAWNRGLKEAKGELFVSIVDGIWFEPYLLERLWQHYERDPMSCVSLAGHHYDRIEFGKPEHLVWVDPKVKNTGAFEQINPVDFELCIASLPIKGVKEVGAFDESFDRFPAWSEKDLACRLEKIGYKCYIDQSIQFRAIHHSRLNNAEWDKKFPESSVYFQKCYKEIEEGKRLKLLYL